MTTNRELMRDLALTALVAVACVGLGGLATSWIRGDPSWELWIYSGIASYAISIPTLFLISTSFVTEYPAAAPLLPTIWRGGSYFLIVLLRDATNWPADNFFLTCLQGCYFPFLLLESALFINRLRQ